MPDMDVDPPDRQTLCCKRYDLFSTIESEEILVSNFNEVINVPDTPQNYQMKEIVKKQIREHQQGNDAALTELDLFPPCNTPGCFYCSKIKLHSNSPSPMLEEPLIIDENPPIKNDENESAEISLPKQFLEKVQYPSHFLIQLTAVSNPIDSNLVQTPLTPLVNFFEATPPSSFQSTTPS
ncbi:hypothetical protein TNCT_164971 [Trichonephila clavata]|uniref:Uncharacterized protein n=1 Tax=Trichonephila clavata TaxID=2740835 RepID=A0A8X6FDQ8_TRICU|nr:hypothetical protein TNCT_164971 [Trichonephila clavata]